MRMLALDDLVATALGPGRVQDAAVELHHVQFRAEAVGAIGNTFFASQACPECRIDHQLTRHYDQTRLGMLLALVNSR